MTGADRPHDADALLQELGRRMSELSEACMAAGWLGGTEYLVPELCRRAIDQQQSQRWGHGEVHPERAAQLMALADQLGHWADLDEAGVGYVAFDPFPTPPEYRSALDREAAPAPRAPSLATVEDALGLLVTLGAVPHLVQHHRLVAEAATELCDGLAAAGLARFDRQEVLVGAALHDAGKALHPAEMHGGGSEHERAGHRLLLDHGVPERLARHAWMHAAWHAQEELEPLLVALADKLWKGKRVADLEERAVGRLAAVSGRDVWAVWSEVDAIVEGVAASADGRLARSATGGD